MEARFQERAACPEILSELSAGPTGLGGNALVFVTGRHRSQNAVALTVLTSDRVKTLFP